MARLDDLDREDFDRDGEGTEQTPEHPVEPAQPTNPADNPNEQPQR